ncbi:unnamed protein product [Blepharisma stoltei]|uniref:rRNA biogenesis protein RRP36 n=1 Tax=Blepharisma stoltei TaxID=1481888 RepID=A0AAU9IQJ7_9CILI|nr:unnamed protein product [Blepharisma stoltei]
MDDIPLRKIIEQQKVGKEKPRSHSPPKKFEKHSKHAPKEISSKHPVSRFKKIKFPKPDEDPEHGIFTKKIKKRDPRFDNLSGKFNQGFFEKSYSFIDDYLSQELKELQESLDDPAYAADRGRIKELIIKKKQEIQRAKDEQRYTNVKRKMMKEEREKVKAGKKPYFFKKKIIKMQAMKEKLEELKETGEISKYLKRKRKRETAKETAEVNKAHKKRKTEQFDS